MAEVETEASAPAGFNSVAFAGIGLSCEMLEPVQPVSPADWSILVSELDSWGNVPDPEAIDSLSVVETDRGPVITLSTGSVWLAEFLPWGSDGRLRARAKAAPEGSRVPSGGYSWQGTDLIIKGVKRHRRADLT